MSTDNREANIISGTFLFIENVNSTLAFSTTDSTPINLESIPAVAAFLLSRETYVVRFLQIRYAPRSSPIAPLDNWARLRLLFPSVSTPNQSGSSIINDYPINLRLASSHTFGPTALWFRVFRKATSTTTARPLFPVINFQFQSEFYEGNSVGAIQLDYVISSETIIQPPSSGTGGNDNIGGQSIG